MAKALLPPGTVVCELRIPHRAVPWKASTVPRKGRPFKDKKLIEWQRTVAAYARDAMAGRPPYGGPVYVQMWFYLTKSRNGSVPDLRNMEKSTEDALQGVAIVNDRRAWKGHGERLEEGEHDYDRDWTMVRVVAATPERRTR